MATRITGPLLAALTIVACSMGHGWAFAGSLTVLHSFEGATDGAAPGPVTVDDQGTIYGTTLIGGPGTNPAFYCYSSVGLGCGTVYKLDTAGHFITLVAFDGSNGAAPFSRLIVKRQLIYGTTSTGGTNKGRPPNPVWQRFCPQSGRRSFSTASRVH